MDCIAVKIPTDGRVIIMKNTQKSRDSIAFLKDHFSNLEVFDVTEKCLDSEFWRFISEFF